MLEWKGVFEWPECAALHLEKWSLESELSEWIMVSDWVVDACWASTYNLCLFKQAHWEGVVSFAVKGKECANEDILGKLDRLFFSFYLL